MSTKIRLQYFGFDGDGPTVKEAKANAGRKIEALHEGYWTPVTRSWRGHTFVMWRDLAGWNYGWLEHDGKKNGITGGCLSGKDYRETLRDAERHLADIGWTYDDPLDMFPDWYTDREGQRDIIGRRQWALAMRQLLKQGVPDEQARRIIGGFENAPEGIVLWPKEVLR